MAEQEKVNGYLRIGFQILLAVAIGVGGWFLSRIHDQVYTETPKTYVFRQNYFEMRDETNRRLVRLEEKVDRLNQRLSQYEMRSMQK